MKPIIAVPSYNNPDSKCLPKLKSVGLEVYLYVRREQVPQYRKYKELGYHIVSLNNVSEIGMTRAAVVKHLYSIGVNWAFMLDDDVSKVELLGYNKSKDRWDSKRIMGGSQEPPRMEKRAFQLWYRLAKKHDLSLSSPIYRPEIHAKGPHILVNKSAVIQCVLLKIPDIIAVGNYRNIWDTGNEDYYIQYKLMDAGCLTGKIGVVEYDCPSMGGNTENLITKQKAYIEAFQRNVYSGDRMSTKTTKTGIPSLAFVWKQWGGMKIPLEDTNYGEN